MSSTLGKIAIVGSGIVGRCWAVVFAKGKYTVQLFDTEKKQLEVVLPDVTEKLKVLLQDNLLKGQTVEEIVSRITTTDNLTEALNGAIYVQECIPENVDLKIKIFTQLDSLASPGAILASSTSAIPASKFTENLKGRNRCLVSHPINPPHVVPLVEIVPAPWTDEAVTAKTRLLMESVGNKPVVLKKEVPAFAQNRLQYALLAEAFRLVEDGVLSPEDVDTTVVYGLSMRYSFMGPFQTIDLNAPNGVGDYCNRYLDGIYKVLATEDNSRRISPETVEKIDKHQRSLYPKEKIGEAVSWRDKRLMALCGHYNDCQKIDEKLFPKPHSQ